MRKLISVLTAVALTLAAAACKRTPQVETIEDGNEPALSSVHAANLRGTIQFLSGIHELENNAYRWTMGKFSLILQPPQGTAQDGARLEFRFVLPDSVISRRKAVTLAASVEGQALAPETYTGKGEFTYVRDVPVSVLGAGPVKVDFALDKYLAAGEVEERELGVLFLSAALLPR
jgi:hypothetical protein